MKIKEWFQKSIALLNWVEGITHLIIASIGLWGCIALGIFDVRIIAPIIEIFIFGVFSILTGVVMLNMVKKKHKAREPDIKAASKEYAERFHECNEVTGYVRQDFEQGVNWALRFYKKD